MNNNNNNNNNNRSDSDSSLELEEKFQSSTISDPITELTAVVDSGLDVVGDALREVLKITVTKPNLPMGSSVRNGAAQLCAMVHLYRTHIRKSHADAVHIISNLYKMLCVDGKAELPKLKLFAQMDISTDAQLKDGKKQLDYALKESFDQMRYTIVESVNMELLSNLQSIAEHAILFSELTKYYGGDKTFVVPPVPEHITALFGTPAENNISSSIKKLE